MKGIFISYPFSCDPVANVAAVVAIARSIALDGDLPVAPHLYLPALVDEGTERALALQMCLALVARCDEVRVHGAPSAGMRLEIAEARRLGIPVLDGETGEPFVEKEPPQ